MYMNLSYMCLRWCDVSNAGSSLTHSQSSRWLTLFYWKKKDLSGQADWIYFIWCFLKNQVLIRRMAGFLPVFSVFLFFSPRLTYSNRYTHSQQNVLWSIKKKEKMSRMKNLRAIECGYQCQTPNINFMYAPSFRYNIHIYISIHIHTYINCNCTANIPITWMNLYLRVHLTFSL